MDNAIDFILNNWEYISAAALWVAVRIIPTKRNYDIVEIVLTAIGKILPNIRKDSLGNTTTKPK